MCAQLVNGTSGAPLQWGTGDFWEITGQKAFQWSDQITSGANAGDSWCICMWATEDLIEDVGCDHVHINCTATDVCYVLASYTDGGTDLTTAKDCIEEKCPKEANECSSGRTARNQTGNQTTLVDPRRQNSPRALAPSQAL